MRFEILKIALAGHGARYLRSPRSCFPSVWFGQTWTHILNSDDNLPIHCLSSATQQCVQLVFVNVFSFWLYILSMNPSWLKSVFSKQPKEATLWRAQEVTFFVQWNGEGQNPLWAWAVIFVTSTHMRDRISKVFRHPVTAASRAPRFKTTWPISDGLWGREWVRCKFRTL